MDIFVEIVTVMRINAPLIYKRILSIKRLRLGPQNLNRRHGHLFGHLRYNTSSRIIENVPKKAQNIRTGTDCGANFHRRLVVLVGLTIKLISPSANLPWGLHGASMSIPS